MPATSRRLPAVADAVALVALVAVGSASHGQGSSLSPFLRTGVPLLVVWFGAAWILRTYRRGDVRTLVATWLVSVPVAGVIRSAVSDGPWDGTLLVFVGVALAFTFLFLAAGRVAVGVLTPRESRSLGTSR